MSRAYFPPLIDAGPHILPLLLFPPSLSFQPACNLTVAGLFPAMQPLLNELEASVWSRGPRLDYQCVSVCVTTAGFTEQTLSSRFAAFTSPKARPGVLTCDVWLDFLRTKRRCGGFLTSNSYGAPNNDDTDNRRSTRSNCDRRG